MQGWFIKYRPINVTHCISGLKDRNQNIISVDEIKTIAKICHLDDKSLGDVRGIKKYLGIGDKPTTNIILK